MGNIVAHTMPVLAWMIDDKALEPHVPVWEKSARTRHGPFHQTGFGF